LEEGQYYLHQISGFFVETKQGREVGRIKDFLSVPNNDLLIVEGYDQMVLIPFVESICVLVDIANRRVVIDPPEGLLELNEI
jgi:16S rRNA processing protein RimM